MTMDVPITLEELPTEDKIASIGTKKILVDSISGISVKNLTPNEKNTFQVKLGVVVTNIDESINNNYDLKQGDIITKINNKNINNVNDFTKTLNNVKNNSYANLLVYRQSTPIFIALKISK